MAASGNILLGVTGGIAAYKTPVLVRLLTKHGSSVQVVMTKAAANFVTPVSLATVSGKPVQSEMWNKAGEPNIAHIEAADWADIAVIAPATANFIGKAVAGIADDALTTILTALTCPVLVCPAMNVNMWRNPIVQRNVKSLMDLGYHILTPDSGWLACGWTGEGRMPEPEVIFQRILSMLSHGDLTGVKILVTAGPTEEPIDPVRFITNRSSGKMGAALCRRAAARGAEVTLIAGPMRAPIPPGINLIKVRTGLEMYESVLAQAPNADIVIKAAAVADFRPLVTASGKLKKDVMEPTITLVQNPDILLELGRRKQDGQILVGFAAETDNPVENGRKKLRAKNLDMLVLNDVTKPGAGFDYDTNIVRLLFADGKEEQTELMSKDAVADLILDRVSALRNPTDICTDKACNLLSHLADSF